MKETLINFLEKLNYYNYKKIVHTTLSFCIIYIIPLLIYFAILTIYSLLQDKTDSIISNILDIAILIGVNTLLHQVFDNYRINSIQNNINFLKYKNIIIVQFNILYISMISSNLSIHFFESFFNNENLISNILSILLIILTHWILIMTLPFIFTFYIGTLPFHQNINVPYLSIQSAKTISEFISKNIFNQKTVLTIFYICCMNLFGYFYIKSLRYLFNSNPKLKNKD
ncbi:Uncharacterised protein [Streptococcus suis]|nr:Uncharacterised protein [Streptococcus suis]